jgi:hypothetical protein
MTQDEIIEMARQAGIGWGERLGGMPEFLERFAKLVAQHERDRMCEQCKWRNHENTTHNETN